MREPAADPHLLLLLLLLLMLRTPPPSIPLPARPCADIAGFPKDAYYYYEAWWANNASSLHLSPQDWTAPVPEGDPIDVYVYAVAPTVELIVNGVSRGNQSMPAYGSVRWPAVPFHPGTLTAVGYGADGAAVATQTVETAGPAVGLALWVRSSSGGSGGGGCSSGDRRLPSHRGGSGSSLLTRAPPLPDRARRPAPHRCRRRRRSHRRRRSRRRWVGREG